MILNPVVAVYAAKGQFGKAQYVLRELLPEINGNKIEDAELAYLAFWAFGKSSLPLVSKDVERMSRMAEITANTLRNGDLIVEAIIEGGPRWERMGKLVRKVKEVAGAEDKKKGIDEAVALSWKILNTFSKDDGIVEFENLAMVIDVIAENGQSEDWRKIQKLIAKQPLMEDDRIRLFTEFALKIRKGRED